MYPLSLLERLVAEPDAIAFEHGAAAISRRQLVARVGAYQRLLRRTDVGPGVGVAIATAVTAEGFAAQLAAHSLGARVVGLGPSLTEAQLRHIVGDVSVVLADAVRDTVELRSAADARPVLAVSVDRPDADLELIALGRPDDVAVVTFTSGSTGTPKGVATNYQAMSAHWAHAPDRWSDRTRELAAGYRRFALFGTLASAVMQEHLALCLASGGTAVIPDGIPVFPDLFEQLRISACLLTVPRLHAVLDALADRPLDLSSLRSVLVAGSPLSPARLAQMFSVFGTAARQGYGQTETGMLTLLLPSDVAAYPDALNSVGRPMPGVDVEVRDGELWVRSASQMCGYWQDPIETAEVLSDGWIRTRDLGRVTDDGFVELTGRARDVVIVNAIVHYAGPIEQLLAQSADVDQAYLVGVPDERTGEAAHAFLVPAPGRRPDTRALSAAVADAFGAGAVPSSFVEIEVVPVGPSGKPDKRALAARALADHPS